MIGSCEACGKNHLPVRRFEMSGMESVQCFRCVGDAEADPHGEMAECECILCLAEQGPMHLRTHRYPGGYSNRWLELQQRLRR